MHVALAGCLVALGLTVWSALALTPQPYGGLLAADRQSRFFDGVFLVAGALALLLSHAWLTEHDCESASSTRSSCSRSPA